MFLIGAGIVVMTAAGVILLGLGFTATITTPAWVVHRAVGILLAAGLAGAGLAGTGVYRKLQGELAEVTG